MTAWNATLAVHVASGTAGLVLGPIAMLAPKRRGRHTRTGEIYHWVMLTICLSASAMAVMAWSRIWWLLPIAAFSYANALVGYLAAKRRPKGWLRVHIRGMGGSYIALSTALLVVNVGPSPLIVWFLPTIVGAPLIELVIRRRTRASRRVPAAQPAPARASHA